MIRLMAIVGVVIFYISLELGILLENKPWKSLDKFWYFFFLTSLMTMFTALLLKVAVYM